MKHLDISMNEEANRYIQNGDTFLEKIFPFWIASNLDRMKILLIPLLTLLFPLVKGVLPLYKWSIRSKIYQWYEEVREADLALSDSNEQQIKNQLKKLESLHDEIKAETKIPMSYMGKYYNLIMHLELIISKTKERLVIDKNKLYQ